MHLVSPRFNDESVLATMNLRRAILLTTVLMVQEGATLTNVPASRLSLKAWLQKCHSPQDVLNFIEENLNTNSDPLGAISSLCLVRLSKQLIHMDNQYRHEGRTNAWKSTLMDNQVDAWRTLSDTLARAMQADIGMNQDVPAALECVVEGVKSISIISRILPEMDHFWEPCLDCFQDRADQFVQHGLQPHQLSGLNWAFHVLKMRNEERNVPASVKDAYDDLNLPFRIRPGCMAKIPDFELQTLVSQVNYQVDTIRTSSNVVVSERRKTAWEGDDGVAPFSYSGKSMETNRWSPLVKATRDCLLETTGIYYDGCLLNLYPDGGSGMRYHIDPDQGVLWDYETAVVSVGATRRFSLRKIPSVDEHWQPHTFVLMQGDVVEMFGDCQSLFQHTVRTADEKNEEAARASLVFKRTLST
jgi:alkylated DNA repair dioxygenase AlkB